MGGTLNIGSIKHESSSVDNMILGTDGSLTFGGEVRTPNETLTGQHPGISFVNSEFEVDTTGWNLYANAASTVPTDGKAGGYTVGTTFTASDTLPLMGLRSGLFSKDTSNRQGKGVSYDFTVSRGNTVGPIEIRFLYETSTSYVSGDMKVYIFDVTNNTVMYPSIIDIPATNNAPAIFQSVFLPSTSNSYRLIFHVATTNASAYTLKLDNIKVGEQTTAVGAAIGNWNTYTPVLSGVGAKGTLLLYGKWRRVGSNMEIMCYWNGNTTASGDAGSTGFTFSIPSGYTIPIPAYGTFPTDTENYGYYTEFSIKNASQYSSQGQVIPSSSTTLGFVELGSNSTLYVSDLNISRAVQISFYVSVPISQWTSNVNLASDFTEYAYNTSTSTTTDTTSFGYGTEGALIKAFAPTGLNQVLKRVRFRRPIQSTDLVILEFDFQSKNIWQLASDFFPVQNNDAGTVAYGASLVRVGGTTTDYDVSFYSAANKITGETWAAYNTTKWRVRKVSNGNMAEVPPTVKLTASGPSINGPSTLGAGDNTFKFTSVTVDSHSGYNLSTGGYTVPVSGEYLVLFVITFYGDPSYPRADNKVWISKNGGDPTVSTYSYFGLPTISTIYYYPVHYSVTISCVAGDILTPKVNLAALSGCLGGTPTHLQITRIGS